MTAPLSSSDKPFLRVMNGEALERRPIWLMRQAGRYLPEYRDWATAPSFLDFCYTPRLAAEATLQPIRRFGFDAAILFSDILVVPDALGQPVSFETGRARVCSRSEAKRISHGCLKNRPRPSWSGVRDD